MILLNVSFLVKYTEAGSKIVVVRGSGEEKWGVSV